MKIKYTNNKKRLKIMTQGKRNFCKHYPKSAKGRYFVKVVDEEPFYLCKKCGLYFSTSGWETDLSWNTNQEEFKIKKICGL